jgi:RimJ/RimL family protein N-acetyltransferase
MPVEVTLSPVTAASAEIVARWLSDPNINRWLYGDFRNATVSPRQVVLLASSPRNELWTIACDGAPCGVIALSHIDRHDQSASIWYLIGDPRYLGRGVATRAVRQAVALAFQQGLQSLNASVMAGNDASGRVLERSGFRLAGVMRNGVRLDDRFVDRLMYDVLPADVVEAAPVGTQ